VFTASRKQFSRNSSFTGIGGNSVLPEQRFTAIWKTVRHNEQCLNGIRRNRGSTASAETGFTEQSVDGIGRKQCFTGTVFFTGTEVENHVDGIGGNSVLRNSVLRASAETVPYVPAEQCFTHRRNSVLRNSVLRASGNSVLRNKVLRASAETVFYGTVFYGHPRNQFTEQCLTGIGGNSVYGTVFDGILRNQAHGEAAQ
jgi:hypothetical protein